MLFMQHWGKLLPFLSSAFAAPSSILITPWGFNEKAIQHLRLASFDIIPAVAR
jgi:hypothetical protein